MDLVYGGNGTGFNYWPSHTKNTDSGTGWWPIPGKSRLMLESAQISSSSILGGWQNENRVEFPDNSLAVVKTAGSLNYGFCHCERSWVFQRGEVEEPIPPQLSGSYRHPTTICFQMAPLSTPCP